MENSSLHPKTFWAHFFQRMRMLKWTQTTEQQKQNKTKNNKERDHKIDTS
jgi:hypothetical protein